MTRLVFTGERNGREISITWQDGMLSGDPGACRWIRRYAAAMEGRIVGPIGGPYTNSRHLANPYVAAELIRSVFPGKVTMEGELPLRSAPPGAVR